MTGWHHIACERGRTATDDTCLCWARYAAALGVGLAVRISRGSSKGDVT